MEATGNSDHSGDSEGEEELINEYITFWSPKSTIICVTIKTTMVFFIYIKAEYDNVSIPKLLQTLQELEILGGHIHIINQLLTEVPNS